MPVPARAMNRKLNLREVIAPSPHYTALPEMISLTHRLQMQYRREIIIFALEVSDPYTIGGEMTVEVGKASVDLTARIRSQPPKWEETTTMHEFSVVESLINMVLAEIKSRGISRVVEVHVRRGSTFAEAPLRQAFQILSENTPLQGAELIVEEYSVSHTCESCGREQVVRADDLIGHLFICPQCGASKEIDEAHGLHLLGIKY